MTEDDFDLLAVWLGRDHVQAWWRDPTAPAKVAQKYGPPIRGEVPAEVFVVLQGGVDVGIIQRYRIADHADWCRVLASAGFGGAHAAGIDELLGEPRSVGLGAGTTTIGSSTTSCSSSWMMWSASS